MPDVVEVEVIRPVTVEVVVLRGARGADGDAGTGGGEDLDAHIADTTDVHGIPDTAVLATGSSVTAAVEAHRADTTNIHGIVDTALLATQAFVTAAIDALVDGAPGALNTFMEVSAALAADDDAFAALQAAVNLRLLASNNLSDLTSVATAQANLQLGAAALRAIGTSAGQIRDAADAAYTNERTPIDGSVTTAKIDDGAVTAEKLAVPGWQVIHDRTLGAVSASETFALTGTMWRIRIMGRVTTTASGSVALRATLNGDGGANYSSAGAAATTSLTVSNITASNTNTDRPSAIDLDLAHRTGHWTAGYSIPLVVASNATLSPGAANPQPHVWRSTAPPTSLELFPSTSTFVAGTRFIVEAFA